MKRIFAIISLYALTLTIYASDAIQARLEPISNRTGWFIVHMTNVSTNTVRFLDIREGAGWCGEFYEVTVVKGGETFESKGNCLYSPGDVPRVITVLPGNTYERDIQPGAYVRSEKHLEPPCSIRVTYRLTDNIKSRCRGLGDDVDFDLTFQTDTAEIGIEQSVPGYDAQGASYPEP